MAFCARILSKRAKQMNGNLCKEKELGHMLSNYAATLFYILCSPYTFKKIGLGKYLDMSFHLQQFAHRVYKYELHIHVSCSINPQIAHNLHL